MTKRRSTGDGGIHWDERRRRWIATASLGYDPAGRRIVKRGSGSTKSEAKAKLREVLRTYDDGLAIAPAAITVADAVNDWLHYGLTGRDHATRAANGTLCRKHVLPALGARKLRDLSAEDVDKWLADKSRTLSTRTLQQIHSCLNRSIKRAMARDKVKRNVVALCSAPSGQAGRPSKSLTLAQAEAVLEASADSRMHPYIVLSLLTGARTEELRALRWDHVDLIGAPRPIRRCRRTWPSGARYAKVATPRPRSRAGPWPCRLAASMRCAGSISKSPRIAGSRVAGGSRTISSSRRRLELRSTRPTCAATSAVPSPARRASSPRSGLRASCGTASCPCCRTTASPSTRSPAWWATAAAPSRSWSTANRVRPVLQVGAVAMDRIFAVEAPNEAGERPVRES